RQPFQFWNLQSSILYPFTHSLIHSSTHSLIHSSTHSLIHSSTHSLIHSFLNATHPSFQYRVKQNKQNPGSAGKAYHGKKQTGNFLWVMRIKASGKQSCEQISKGCTHEP